MEDRAQFSEFRQHLVDSSFEFVISKELTSLTGIQAEKISLRRR